MAGMHPWSNKQHFQYKSGKTDSIKLCQVQQKRGPQVNTMSEKQSKSVVSYYSLLQMSIHQVKKENNVKMTPCHIPLA